MANSERPEPQDAEMTFNLCDYDELDVTVKDPGGRNRFYLYFIRSKAKDQEVHFGSLVTPHASTSLDVRIPKQKVARRKGATKREVTLHVADYKKLEVYVTGEGDERLCQLSTQGHSEREQSHFYVPGRDGSLHDLTIYPPDPEWAEKQ